MVSRLYGRTCRREQPTRRGRATLCNFPCTHEGLAIPIAWDQQDQRRSAVGPRTGRRNASNASISRFSGSKASPVISSRGSDSVVRAQGPERFGMAGSWRFPILPGSARDGGQTPAASLNRSCGLRSASQPRVAEKAAPREISFALNWFGEEAVPGAIVAVHPPIGSDRFERGRRAREAYRRRLRPGSKGSLPRETRGGRLITPVGFGRPYGQGSAITLRVVMGFGSSRGRREAIPKNHQPDAPARRVPQEPLAGLIILVDRPFAGWSLPSAAAKGRRAMRRN